MNSIQWILSQLNWRYGIIQKYDGIKWAFIQFNSIQFKSIQFKSSQHSMPDDLKVRCHWIEMNVIYLNQLKIQDYFKASSSFFHIFFSPGFWLHQPGAVDGEPLVCLQGDGHHRSLHAASASPGETTRRRCLRPAGGVRTGPLRRQPGWIPTRLQPAGIQPGDRSAPAGGGSKNKNNKTFIDSTTDLTISCSTNSLFCLFVFF